jgi:hypothetical protein
MTDDSSSYAGKELEAMSFASNYHKWIVDEFAPFLGQTVVEVGAGTGALTAMLLQMNIDHLYSFEPASNLFPLLSRKMEGQSRVSLINDFFRPELAPDVINSLLYINVLEHIEDDNAELTMAYNALGSGGYLLLFVPALQWLFSEADKSVGHFRRYYKKDLVSLVKETGFTIEKSRYFDCAGVLPWYVNFVLLKKSFGNSSVALYDKVVVPPMRIIEKFLKPPTGKNILVVAKKN